LVELLSVCVIIGVLASFLLPVLMQSVRAAHVSTDVQRLKQLHLAFSLYRADWDGDGNYGVASKMGLPDAYLLEASAWKAVVNNSDMWKSPCGLHPDNEPFGSNSVHFVYPPCNQEVGCGEYYSMHQDNSMLLIDTNCADRNVPLSAPFDMKLVVGVRLNGQAKTIRTRKRADALSNWH
jgi:type II secretory pathway pseudopilin PulG